MSLNDLTGRKFTRLTVMKRAENKVGKDGRSRVMWECKCDCGKTVAVDSANLTCGKTMSCGCLQAELLSKRRRSHGDTETRLYRIWQQMKNRCNNPNVIAYPQYGGRGICVCDEWMHDFVAFKEWSVANGYTDKLTIDRINNDGNYCPDNCRWVTAAVQANNRRSNVIFDYNGEKHNMTEWAKIIGINPRTLRSRYHAGWSVDRMLSTT